MTNEISSGTVGSEPILHLFSVLTCPDLDQIRFSVFWKMTCCVFENDLRGIMLGTCSLLRLLSDTVSTTFSG